MCQEQHLKCTKRGDHKLPLKVFKLILQHFCLCLNPCHMRLSRYNLCEFEKCLMHSKQTGGELYGSPPVKTNQIHNSTSPRRPCGQTVTITFTMKQNTVGNMAQKYSSLKETNLPTMSGM